MVLIYKNTRISRHDQPQAHQLARVQSGGGEKDAGEDCDEEGHAESTEPDCVEASDVGIAACGPLVMTHYLPH